jgi:hypothetical protein
MTDGHSKPKVRVKKSYTGLASFFKSFRGYTTLITDVINLFFFADFIFFAITAPFLCRAWIKGNIRLIPNNI